MTAFRTLRVALLGMGRIGRELVRRTSSDPDYIYVALADRSGAIAEGGGFPIEELEGIIARKEKGVSLQEMGGGHGLLDIDEFIESCEYDVLVDATDAQTRSVILRALDRAHLVVSNKVPLADIPYDAFRELVSKARRLGRVLDLGTTVGAGMRLPDMIEALGADGLERVEGCLSGTMNYLSQRLNEGAALSTALREAMSPPRLYAEPDPRADLRGVDFARKLTITARLCGRDAERGDIAVEDILPPELSSAPLEAFLKLLSTLDGGMAERVRRARAVGGALWYLGVADLERGEYSVGFREVPTGDPVASSRESDNIIKLYPRLWRRPVTIVGPGAGVPETVTGLMAGLRRVQERVRGQR